MGNVVLMTGSCGEMRTREHDVSEPLRGRVREALPRAARAARLRTTRHHMRLLHDQGERAPPVRGTSMRRDPNLGRGREDSSRRDLARQ